MPKIKIDDDACIGCGLCQEICPATFQMKDFKAIVKKATVAKITKEKEAADSCPVQAIKIST